MSIETTTAVVPFDFHGNQIRTIEVEGEVWFVASDVAKALGYAKPENAIERHCKGTLKRGILTRGGVQSMSTIPERDVYRLVMHSQLPKAVEFEEWVVGTVLPSIRKTGGYILGEEQMSEDELVLAAMKVLQKKVEVLTKQVETLEPKAISYDLLTDTDDTMTLTEALKLATPHTNKAIRFLHFRGLFYKTNLNPNMPKANIAKYFHLVDQEDGYGVFRGIQTRVTVEGQGKLVKYLNTYREEFEAFCLLSKKVKK